MFNTHKVNPKGFEEIAIFKGNLSAAVKTVENLMPEGRDKALFVTKLEEAVFFGTRAIAMKTDNCSEVIEY